MPERTTSRARRAVLIVLPLFVLSLLAVDPALTRGVESPVTGQQGLESAPAPCDYLVPPGTGVVDGARDAWRTGPGTVICLAPGERGNLKLFNLHGSPEAPIVVRNSDGPTLITGRDFEAGILIATSTHLHITGTGVASACGASVASAEQDCGIRLDGTNKGIRVLTARGPVQGLEIDHLSIARPSGIDTRGIAIHPTLGQVVAGIRIHHNHVSGTGAEAIYIGSEPRDTTWADLGKVDAVEVAHNLIENIGWDGIKVKVALGESRIHDNVIRNVGTARYERHQSAITVAMSAVDVYDNAIRGVPEGIKSGRAVAGSTNRFHGNLVTDVTSFGIQTVDSMAQIYSNTIARSAAIGIRARGDGSRIVDNIVAGAPRPIVARKDAQVRSNLVGTLAEVGFVDPEQDDFRPGPASPAFGGGSIARLELCPQAGMRAWRPVRFSVHSGRSAPTGPVGCRADLGAQQAASSTIR